MLSSFHMHVQILFRLLNAGTFDAIHGCVSTGKEANVYHATAGEAHLKALEADGGSGAYSRDLAVKVYKTSILVFKDRDRYVARRPCVACSVYIPIYVHIYAVTWVLSVIVVMNGVMCRYVRGDVRFSSKYSKGNPRKMVATWAEKEMRNLHRLAAAGVPCPKARARRKHVLVMDFVGSNGIAAPRLKVGVCWVFCVNMCCDTTQTKPSSHVNPWCTHQPQDAQLSHDALRTAYRELLRLMWVLWAKARLVHADLSEYNILVHNVRTCVHLPCVHLRAWLCCLYSQRAAWSTPLTTERDS